MAGLNRRSSFSSSTVSSSSLAKRPAMENAPKVSVSAPENAKKRMALGNLTNQCNAGRSGSRQPGAKGNNVGEIRKKANTTVSAAKVKKGPSGTDPDKSFRRNYSITPSIIKPVTCGPRRSATPAVRNEATVPVGSLPVPCNSVLSPKRSGDSVSVDETMSTCDSMKSPDFEYIDNADSSVVASLERKATHNLYISDNFHSMGHGRKSGVPVAMEIDSITNVDDNYKDPQLCASLACDIYQHLRFAETKKRPSMDFMERVQEDINANMRAILIDWLVEVAEEYRLVPDTLYLTVNYIDRYLSDNKINRQRLQLLGVACMLIAAKYEEICAPQVEEFCYITDNTYFKDEVLQMEANVLKFLKFEMTSPTAKCFLRRFVRVAQCSDEVPSSLQLEFLANYLAELSLLEYSMLCHSPSRIAAASVFLAKFILQPSKRPWNATLVHYTQYKPSELGSCVKDLHRLCCNNSSNSLPAIREKYSQHKYKFVAKKYCSAVIPPEFFQDSCK
ncbi:Cyclin-A1-1 [Apostasia shenzhenica]|uniref:Cyclin-A1-1 n=1 Tax=Apostasia shenzhenica TaxID=1088818 RepID=A0A2H9ZVF4_9ASPA|nr:Cyclin-A1-1 [Apostasia shenzhenica]